MGGLIVVPACFLALFPNSQIFVLGIRWQCL